jgi:hypothetical protein
MISFIKKIFSKTRVTVKKPKKDTDSYIYSVLEKSNE